MRNEKTNLKHYIYMNNKLSSLDLGILVRNNRVKATERQAPILHIGPKKQQVSLLNEK